MKMKGMSINPRVIKQLGSELITSSSVAFVELIKNSIEAGSDEVRIHLLDTLKNVSSRNLLIQFIDKINSFINLKYASTQILIIEDIGIGMDEHTIDNGFLNIGTDIKISNPSLVKNEVTLGEKGLGRLATQRLGRCLIVETKSQYEDVSNLVVIDWDEIEDVNNINEIKIPFFNVETDTESYTRLWIFDTKINELVDESNQINLFKLETTRLKADVESAITFIKSPYIEDDKKFSIKVYRNDCLINCGFDRNYLKVAESTHSFSIKSSNGRIELEVKLGLSPWFLQKTHRSLIKPTSHYFKYKLTSEEYDELFNKYEKRFSTSLQRIIGIEDLANRIVEVRKRNYTDEIEDELLTSILFEKVNTELSSLLNIIPINGELYSYKQDHAVGNGINFNFARQKFDELKDDKYSFDGVKTLLDRFNGIKLYRNNYRIGFLGNKNDDWIHMQQYRIQGQQFYRLNQSNSLGYVCINDSDQKYIREISSRLDINENDTAKIFKEVIIYVFNHLFYELNRTADELTKNILKDEGLTQEKTKEKIIEANEKNKFLMKENKRLAREIKETKKTLMESATESDGNTIISNETFNKVIQTLDESDVQVSLMQTQYDENKKVLEEAKAGIRRIEVEAFNNYKLMANGLITETITHELHSIIDSDNLFSLEGHFTELKEYLMFENVKMYNFHFLPLRDQTDTLLKKVDSVTDLYQFLEKTFIKNDSFDDYKTENIKELITQIEEKLLKELSKNNVFLDTHKVIANWYLPKGVMLHVLYNLINNSMYWIDIRNKRAQKDEHYSFKEQDKITISQESRDSIIIEDTGTGILPHMEFVLFEPLQSGKEIGGRGMGLYIVKKLLNSFGADIELLELRNQFGNRYKFQIVVPKECYEEIE